jgi:hypothetical protein
LPDSGLLYELKGRHRRVQGRRIQRRGADGGGRFANHGQEAETPGQKGLPTGLEGGDGLASLRAGGDRLVEDLEAMRAGVGGNERDDPEMEDGDDLHPALSASDFPFRAPAKDRGESRDGASRLDGLVGEQEMARGEGAGYFPIVVGGVENIAVQPGGLGDGGLFGDGDAGIGLGHRRWRQQRNGGGLVRGGEALGVGVRQRGEGRDEPEGRELDWFPHERVGRRAPRSSG